MEFPKWLYHKEKEAVLVKDAIEEKKLGKGWAATLAFFGIETHPQVKPDAPIEPKKEEAPKAEPVELAPKEDASPSIEPPKPSEPSGAGQ